jgi:hypothetical protein
MHTIRRTLTAQAAVLIALTQSSVLVQGATFETLYIFKGSTDGKSPNGVAEGSDGSLYGTTAFGGNTSCTNGELPLGCGTLFQLTPVTGAAWTKTTLVEFTGPDGAYPSSNVVFGSNGDLYGTTAGGGNGGGTVFQFAPPGSAGGTWTETLLYSLPGSLTAPEQPNGPLLIGPGAIYGTAYSDGYSCCYTATGGTVFQLEPPSTPGGDWTENTIVDFEKTTSVGGGPSAGLVALGGALFGTNTDFGDCGTVFEVAPVTGTPGTWTATLVYAFQGSDGCGPVSDLTVGPAGTLYGTTAGGGTGGCRFYYSDKLGCGTIFQLTPPAVTGGTWTESVIYSFTGSNGDGAYPRGSVLLGENGVLYGSTAYGGLMGPRCLNRITAATGCGTVFELTPPAEPGGAWTETILHSFTAQNGEGSDPGQLILSPNGVLFGATGDGGLGTGTIFALKP